MQYPRVVRKQHPSGEQRAISGEMLGTREPGSGCTHPTQGGSGTGRQLLRGDPAHANTLKSVRGCLDRPRAIEPLEYLNAQDGVDPDLPIEKLLTRQAVGRGQ